MDSKDSTDDDISEISDTTRKGSNISLDSIDSINKLHYKARSMLEGITPKEQKEIAADMFSQMKQLKATNDVMGYHGFSGVLQRHDSNMNITGDVSPDANNSNNQFIDSHCKLNELKDDSSESYRSDTQNLNTINQKHDDIHMVNYNIASMKNINVNMSNNKQMMLSETKPLRQKLETISMSINKIRQDINDNSVFSNISNKQLNETIMFFQNHLTEIQDQIEDAENDIESNIDVKLLTYMEEIKINKAKIKAMKKEKKEKEKQLQIDKEKDQQKIIQMQRVQINQLIRAQTDNVKIKNKQNHQNLSPIANNHPYSQTMSQLNFTKGNYKSNITPKRRHSISLSSNSETTDMTNNDIQMATNNNLNILINDVGGDMHGIGYGNGGGGGCDECDNNSNNNMQIPLQPTPPTIIQSSPRTNEGHFCYNQSVSQQLQQPLLSDNSIKILGGVAIILSGVWIVSKYFDGKGNNIGSANGYRGPRFKY